MKILTDFCLMPEMHDLLHRLFISWRLTAYVFLPILGITLYKKGIIPRSLIGTINTHLQRDAKRWCSTACITRSFTSVNGKECKWTTNGFPKYMVLGASTFKYPPINCFRMEVS